MSEEQNAAGVPAGWRLVPVEPTQAMLDAVVSSMDDMLLGEAAEQQYRDDWAAMLAAAPQSEAKTPQWLQGAPVGQWSHITKGGAVPMPQNADQAAAMVLIGERWLRDNAPERLNDQQPEAAPAAASVPGRYWVDYDNETGPLGDCLVEWWSVIDEQTGDALCKCDDQASADRIAALLNAATAPAKG